MDQKGLSPAAEVGNDEEMNIFMYHETFSCGHVSGRYNMVMEKNMPRKTIKKGRPPKSKQDKQARRFQVNATPGEGRRLVADAKKYGFSSPSALLLKIWHEWRGDKEERNDGGL